MNIIQEKSVTLQVSRIHKDGWWLGSGDEHVAAGTALGADCTTKIYTPSKEGVTGQFDVNTNTWEEVVDKSNDEFWAPDGQRFTIGVPNGDYPEWAIKIKPPQYNSEIQTVVYENDKWSVFGILIGQCYWNELTDEFIISDFNFTLPDNHTFTAPPKANVGFVVRLVSGKWKQIEDNRDKTIYNRLDCFTSEMIREIGPIKTGWTVIEPATLNDEWINGAWVTNLQNQYESDYNRVDDSRRSLYTTMVDPLFAEANVKVLMGAAAAEINELNTQALAARQKIQTDNPWPVAPKV